MVSSINSKSMDVFQMLSQMKTTFLKNFADSYSKVDHDKEKEIDTQIKSMMAEADKDKDGALTKEELSSIDTKNNPEKARLICGLINSFESYDVNGDKKLSVKELKDALKALEKPFSTQEIAQMAKENRKFISSAGSLPTYESNFANALTEKLISNYKA